MRIPIVIVGGNENTNGLLRQHFPKGTSFFTLNQCDVDMALERINNRLRKTLGLKIAAQMMENHYHECCLTELSAC